MNISPRRSWVVVGSIAAVATVAAVVLSVLTGSEADTPAGPPDVAARANVGLLDDDQARSLVRDVEQYYAALRAGNATKALSYGTAVPDRRLLTDAVLDRQRTLGPIQRVRVDPDVLQVKDSARVDVVVTIGGRAYDETITFDKVGDKWQMPVAAEIGSDVSGSPSLTLFGQTFVAPRKAYVFPGTVQATLASPYVTASDGTTDVAPVPGPSNALNDLEYGLNAAGTAAARAAVQRAMAACAAQRTLSPTGCPNSTVSVTGIEVPNSARWTAPTNYTALMIDDELDRGLDTLDVTGTLLFTVTYAAKDGNASRTVTERVTARLFGSVDLTTSPPTYQD